MYHNKNRIKIFREWQQRPSFRIANQRAKMNLRDDRWQVGQWIQEEEEGGGEESSLARSLAVSKKNCPTSAMFDDNKHTALEIVTNSSMKLHDMKKSINTKCEHKDISGRNRSNPSAEMTENANDKQEWKHYYSERRCTSRFLAAARCERGSSSLTDVWAGEDSKTMKRRTELNKLGHWWSGVPPSHHLVTTSLLSENLMAQLTTRIELFTMLKLMDVSSSCLRHEMRMQTANEHEAMHRVKLILSSVHRSLLCFEFSSWSWRSLLWKPLLFMYVLCLPACYSSVCLPLCAWMSDSVRL